MKAAILAAGRGARLGELGNQTPKGLIRIGSEPIIEQSIRKLFSEGIDEVCIVTGHLSRHFEYLEGQFDRLQFAHNPNYTVSGSMASLHVALNWAQSDLIVLDSDIIYEARGLNLLLSHEADSVLLVSGFSEAGDEVWVSGHPKFVTAISKEAHTVGSEIFGEFVGISKLSFEFLQKMVLAEEHFSGAQPQDYEHFLNLIAKESRLQALHLDDYLWAEIDDVNHLARAESTVFPKIQQAETGRFFTV